MDEKVEAECRFPFSIVIPDIFVTFQGSTCAMVESILRHLNLKTGFLSGPHMMNVTERIRINGTPISEELFAKYFWDLYSRFEEQKVLCIRSFNS